jgi:hypothetical protein
VFVPTLLFQHALGVKGIIVRRNLLVLGIGFILALIAGWVAFPRALYVRRAQPLTSTTKHTAKSPGHSAIPVTRLTVTANSVASLGWKSVQAVTPISWEPPLPKPFWWTTTLSRHMKRPGSSTRDSQQMSGFRMPSTRAAPGWPVQNVTGRTEKQIRHEFMNKIASAGIAAIFGAIPFLACDALRMMA